MSPEELLQVIEKAAREKVTILNLSYKGLSQLPSEIGQLTNLKTLYLDNNKLSQLPSEIGQLTNLKTLLLNYNKLSQLPSEIGQLTNLKILHLDNNKLSLLPPKIGQLTNLHTLYLHNNELSQLPPEIGKLTNLQTLFLDNNQLSLLPPEIGQLTHLQTLNLNNNKLSKLSPEIGQLTNLQILHLYNNQLRQLPPEFGKLTNLKRLDLNKNPIEDPPPEVVTKGTKAIVEYLRQKLEVGDDRLYEAKLIIIGEAGAGKTTLAKKIENPDYPVPTEEDSTKGIEVIQWSFPLENGRNFRVNIWDFGGQEIYHATHQFFLTKRSLYVLVADSRKEDTDFYYWLKVVELLSDNSPLLIVKNEKQDRHRDINERQLRGQFENLKATLATNLATKRGLPEIEQEIKHYISILPHVGSVLPKTWVLVREELETNPRNYISLEEYLDICQQNGFTRRDDKLQLSGYLHDLGVILHFQDDPILNNTVILNPKWGTDAVYRVLDDPQVIRNLGRFTWHDLKNIWSEEQYANKQGELLQLMIKFELCYKIPDNTNTYIAPQLLTQNQPEYDWNETNNLILRYTYDFMPKGMLTRFIVATHPLIDQQLYVWRSGVILNKDETKAEVIEYYGRREIYIRVIGKRKRDLMTIVTHELDKIHNSYKRLKYQKLIPCNCDTCKNSQKPHFYPDNVLHQFRIDNQITIQCQKSYKMVNVLGLIDDIINIQLFPDKLNKPEETMMNYPQSKPTPNLPPEKEVFISYAWKGESEKIANQVDQAFQDKGVTIIRDKRDLGYKGLIKEFMQRIGRGKCVIVIISEKYLKSENCMFELLEIAKNKKFYDRIFPIVLADARIYKPVERIKYIKHWEDEKKQLSEAIKEVGPEFLQGIRDDIDLYTDIRKAIAELTNTLKNMNTLTPEMHQDSGFTEIFQAIEQKLNEN